MELTGECIDDILHPLFESLISTGAKNSSKTGDSLEHLGVILRMTKPRARLSRSWARGRPLFSALGELIWYLSGSDDAASIGRYISHYVGEGKPPVVSGAYGPRIRTRHGFDQLAHIIDKLRTKDGSRRTVIQIYEANDLLIETDVPCTTTLQFHRRGSSLHLSATMRSNDAYIGLPHDIFCFTMIQELVAAELGLSVGEYIHMVGSMHLYDWNIKNAQAYMSEGHHKTAEMPAMPEGDAVRSMDGLIALERRIRGGESIDPDREFEASYWADLARLIQTHFASSDLTRVDEILGSMKDNFYHTFIVDRRGRRPPGAAVAAVEA
ncbi:MAG: thymidylate synthase [Novosphingobium sp.]|uniref:thymidylate synthase n=1 Tax=Novosphingobium sp. TaxID=1874826 RepID=UPI0012D008F3|nr:thymidylate synthase [Novosphingobium sp.]MPS68771.1 thymidylate synthase [Novosphingobium sp.]